MNKITLWTDDTYTERKKYLDFPNHRLVQNYSTTVTDYFSYWGWWKYWCRTAVTWIYYFV
jgi:hypothetical protein